MKLKEMNERIAAACELKPKAVAAVHTETFRHIAAALDKGERVTIPDFGIFTVRDVPGENGAPAKKIVRFRQRDAQEDEEKAKLRERKRAKATEDGAEAAEIATPEAAE